MQIDKAKEFYDKKGKEIVKQATEHFDKIAEVYKTLIDPNIYCGGGR